MLSRAAKVSLAVHENTWSITKHINESIDCHALRRPISRLHCWLQQLICHNCHQWSNDSRCAAIYRGSPGVVDCGESETTFQAYYTQESGLMNLECAVQVTSRCLRHFLDVWGSPVEPCSSHWNRYYIYTASCFCNLHLHYICIYFRNWKLELHCSLPWQTALCYTKTAKRMMLFMFNLLLGNSTVSTSNHSKCQETYWFVFHWLHHRYDWKDVLKVY